MTKKEFEKDLDASLNLIRKLAPDLNEATDVATMVVRRVEQFLNDECSLGLPCEVSDGAAFVERAVPGDHEGGIEVKHFLGYGRVDGNFCLQVRMVQIEWARDENDRDERTRKLLDETTQAWSSCPREVKLGTFSQVAPLLRKIAHRTEETVRVAESTAETVAAVLPALGTGESADPTESERLEFFFEHLREAGIEVALDKSSDEMWVARIQGVDFLWNSRTGLYKGCGQLGRNGRTIIKAAVGN